MKIGNRFKSKNLEELRVDVEAYAKKAGIKLNPDKEIFETVITGLWKNKEMYGELYCPCKVVTGDEAKDEEIICPCVSSSKEIELQGHCLCKLFVV